MLVCSLGLITETIPRLSLLSIGGRLGLCVGAWKIITENKWVRNCVRFGYRLPLKSKPRQSKIPPNPKVSPEAYKVLKEEALGLLEKGAIKTVENLPGAFISSYFAVPKPRSLKFRPILNFK